MLSLLKRNFTVAVRLAAVTAHGIGHQERGIENQDALHVVAACPQKSASAPAVWSDAGCSGWIWEGNLASLTVLLADRATGRPGTDACPVALRGLFDALPGASERDRRRAISACSAAFRQHEGLAAFTCATLQPQGTDEVSLELLHAGDVMAALFSLDSVRDAGQLFTPHVDPAAPNRLREALGKLGRPDDVPGVHYSIRAGDVLLVYSDGARSLLPRLRDLDLSPSGFAESARSLQGLLRDVAPRDDATLFLAVLGEGSARRCRPVVPVSATLPAPEAACEQPAEVGDDLPPSRECSSRPGVPLVWPLIRLLARIERQGIECLRQPLGLVAEATSPTEAIARLDSDWANDRVVQAFHILLRLAASDEHPSACSDLGRLISPRGMGHHAEAEYLVKIALFLVDRKEVVRSHLLHRACQLLFERHSCHLAFFYHPVQNRVVLRLLAHQDSDLEEA